MVISATVDSFFISPSSEEMLRSARKVVLVGVTVLTFLAALPGCVVGCILAGQWWRQKHMRMMREDDARFKARACVLAATAALLTLDVGFRCGVAFAARPVGRAGWWHSRACYYCFGYVVEWLVVGVYAVARLDRRFRRGRMETGQDGGVAVEEVGAGRRRWPLSLNTGDEVFGGSGK